MVKEKPGSRITTTSSKEKGKGRVCMPTASILERLEHVLVDMEMEMPHETTVTSHTTSTCSNASSRLEDQIQVQHRKPRKEIRSTETASSSSSTTETEFHVAGRQTLLRSLAESISSISSVIGRIPWACLWLSDIEKLEEQAASARKVEPVLYASYFRVMEMEGMIVQKWTQPDGRCTERVVPSDGISEVPDTTSSTASKEAEELCRERDGGRCILTKMGACTETAHLYPYSLRDNINLSPLDHTSLWNELQAFWKDDRVDTWRNAISASPDGTEVVDNLITLSPDAHRFYRKGLLPLKPVYLSADNKDMTVKFFWLPQCQCQHDRSREVDIMDFPHIPDNLQEGPGPAQLYHVSSRPVLSGDEIVLHTDDPKRLPLPKWELVEMQWVMQRVVALSGGADVEYRGLGLDEEDEDED